MGKTVASATAKAKIKAKQPSVLSALGPGLITGAADDDPSGIATYSQAGARFGFSLLWTVVLCLPMMIAIQSVAARIGCVTGKGLGANLKTLGPSWLATGLVVLLLVANVINIAADLAAMGEAARLLAPQFGLHVYVIGFGLLALLLQVFLSYHRYVKILKWLTLGLLAYVGVVFAVKVPWGQALAGALVPRWDGSKEQVTMVVAILGTTISPYLFFWQSSQEVEELLDHDELHPLNQADRKAAALQIRRIGIDTMVGMAFSELIAFFVILTTAVTLNANGVDNIETAAQAAGALRPIAGPFAFFLFSVGLIGTGFLAVPVLAGSAAYAVAEIRDWPFGLSHKLHEAKGFYFIIAVAVLGGVGLAFSPLDPIKALYWSAVINGVAAVPIMVATMLVASNRKRMGRYVATPFQRVFGWAATLFMGLAAVAMFVL
jgi:NRAMP (natural resistance-associated macrophage protein)-like metal ion transporter